MGVIEADDAGATTGVAVVLNETSSKYTALPDAQETRNTRLAEELSAVQSYIWVPHAVDGKKLGKLVLPRLTAILQAFESA